jgi:putative transposase
MQNISFKRHRFPPEVIRHAVWLYARFRSAIAGLRGRGVV